MKINVRITAQKKTNRSNNLECLGHIQLDDWKSDGIFFFSLSKLIASISMGCIQLTEIPFDGNNSVILRLFFFSCMNHNWFYTFKTMNIVKRENSFQPIYRQGKIEGTFIIITNIDLISTAIETYI